MSGNSSRIGWESNTTTFLAIDAMRDWSRTEQEAASGAQTARLATAHLIDVKPLI
jgi:hypothetical protein